MSAMTRISKALCTGGAFLAFCLPSLGQSAGLEVLSGGSGVTNGETFQISPYFPGTSPAIGAPSTTFTITNTGAATLTLEGSLSETFICTNFPSSIATNASASFTVAMNPNDLVGTNGGSLIITNNDPANGVFTIQLTGSVSNQPVVRSGAEFSVLGALHGDQVLPSLAFADGSGCLAWEDNYLDKRGSGLGAALMTTGFQTSVPFRVDKAVTGRRAKPHAAILSNGDLLFVWQGSVTLGSESSIYARFAKSKMDPGEVGSNFYTADIRVNTYTADQQADPVVTPLANGSAAVAWSSYQEDGSMWGIYARELSATGKATPKKQVQVNQYTSYNQRNAAMTTLANGNYVIVWVSEQERSAASVDIYARIFSPGLVPVTDEFPINSGTNICNIPDVAPSLDGGFVVVWGQRDALVLSNGWDIFGRNFSATGSPENTDYLINGFQYGDQYNPKIATSPAGSLVVWTSLGEDGSREGVFGRYLAGGSQPAGAEFQVNTTTASQQIHPAVAWNGVDHFLVVWSSFVGSSGFDLYGQSYVLNSQ